MAECQIANLLWEFQIGFCNLEIRITNDTNMPENEPLPGVSLSLAPYTGPWTKAEAAHLLRRSTFGATNQEILDAVTNGLNATLTSLMQIPAIGAPLA